MYDAARHGATSGERPFGAVGLRCFPVHFQHDRNRPQRASRRRPDPNNVAGPYCTKLLADYGADVIKVERPGSGDLARRAGPFPNDEPDPERSALFLNLNTNKRSVAVDLKTAEGRDVVLRLAAAADVLVENFRPSVLPSLGLSYEVLKRHNPSLVMTSITDFGPDGAIPGLPWVGDRRLCPGRGVSL